ncbi:hypothetical protein RF11_08549 [Thelohanellus kitauei]|uniref:Uncharacterized protein n=1 Tax=Thelohanellus kitauei TaxID=669202 RepID=A0A0C2IXH5_THEKT|nr:hypothetical protein RF11_08549 [Thelohanellus kitauei]
MSEESINKIITEAQSQWKWILVGDERTADGQNFLVKCSLENHFLMSITNFPLNMSNFPMWTFESSLFGIIALENMRLDYRVLCEQSFTKIGLSITAIISLPFIIYFLIITKTPETEHLIVRIGKSDIFNGKWCISP